MKQFRHGRAARGFLAAILSVSAAVSALASSDLPRSALRAVLDVCETNSKLTGSPAPCLAVVGSPSEPGSYAVVREPNAAERTIVTPLADLSGIDDPRLLRKGSPNWFARAWDERWRVLALHGDEDPWADAALAINSVQSRTQDHLHIHVACSRKDVREALARRWKAVNPNRFGMLNFRLQGRLYWAMRIDANSLDAVDPFQLVAQGVPGAGRDMGSQTIAVLGAVFANGRKGFYVLADRSDSRRGFAASAERLLDPSCSS